MLAEKDAGDANRGIGKQVRVTPWGVGCSGRALGYVCAALESTDECEGFRELREESFFGFELAGVNATAEATHFYRMLEVEHFVVEEVLDCVTRT